MPHWTIPVKWAVFMELSFIIALKKNIIGANCFFPEPGSQTKDESVKVRVYG